MWFIRSFYHYEITARSRDLFFIGYASFDSFGRLAFYLNLFFRFSFPFFYSLWYCYLVISFPRCVIDTLSALLLYPTSVWGNNRLRIHHLCHPYDFVLALLSLFLAFSPLPPIVLNIHLFWNLTPEFIFIFIYFPPTFADPQKKRKQTAPLHFWFHPSISNPGFYRTVVWISYFWAHQNGGNALDYRYISSFLWKQLLAIFFSFLSDTNILFLIFLIDLPFFMT